MQTRHPPSLVQSSWFSRPRPRQVRQPVLRLVLPSVLMLLAGLTPRAACAETIRERLEFVYSYFIEPHWGPTTPADSQYGFQVHRPGRLHLARVPKQQMMQRECFEFFAGLDKNNDPTWTTTISAKQGVFRDDNGVGWNVSVSFNAGLNRYLLATEHSATHAGKFGLFDAPQPWGPWTTVAYEDNWGNGHVEVSAFYWNFPTKWLSNDGRGFTLVFTGKNSNDSWNTVAGRFLLR